MTISVYFNVKMIVRRYHAYQSVSVAVSKKTTMGNCQTQRSVHSCGDNKRVDRLRKISTVCLMLLQQTGQFSVDLLDLCLKETVLDSSVRNFGGRNFKFSQAGV